MTRANAPQNSTVRVALAAGVVAFAELVSSSASNPSGASAEVNSGKPSGPVPALNTAAIQAPTPAEINQIRFDSALNAATIDEAFAMLNVAPYQATPAEVVQLIHALANQNKFGLSDKNVDKCFELLITTHENFTLAHGYAAAEKQYRLAHDDGKNSAIPAWLEDHLTPAGELACGRLSFSFPDWPDFRIATLLRDYQAAPGVLYQHVYLQADLSDGQKHWRPKFQYTMPVAEAASAFQFSFFDTFPQPQAGWTLTLTTKIIPYGQELTAIVGSDDGGKGLETTRTFVYVQNKSKPIEVCNDGSPIPDAAKNLIDAVRALESEQHRPLSADLANNNANNPQQVTATAESPLIKMPLPELKMNARKDLPWLVSSDAVTTEKLTGKVTLLDFWTVGCKPCMDAVPQLIEFQKKYGKDGFQVISIGWDGEDAPPPEIAQMHKTLPYNLGLMKEEDLKKIGIEAFPVMILVDRNGKVAYADIKNPSAQQIETVLDEKIAKNK